MQILNATTQVKSVMTDRGDFITINPGEISKLIIASRNIIIGTMKLGTPSEVGIIISGSYEFEIASSITGSTPYIYTDLEEAKSKLLDPSIDYKSNLNTSKLNKANEELIRQNEEVINDLNNQIKKLKADLKDASSVNESQLVESERKYKDLESKFINVQTERDRLKSQLTESQDQVSNLTENLNSLRKEYSNNRSYYDEAQKTIDSLSAQLKVMTDEKSKLQSEVDDLKSNMESIESKPDIPVTESEEYKKLQSENQDLKSNLKDATDTIEAMKSKFNSACEKFRITTDENGEWIQLPE
jgi:chromosome segregation ATPase